MGQFEQITVKRRGTPLPEDMPSAEEAAKQHPEGAVYRSSSGKRYRLHHAKTLAARWTEVGVRKAPAKKK